MRGLVAAVADLVAPERCAGCRRLGRSWCGRCAADVASRTLGAYRVLSPLCAEAGLAVWAYVPYEGPMRSVVGAYKDDDRRDLRDVMAPMLRASVTAARVATGEGGAPPLVVPVPSSRASRRRRGDWPLRDLAVAATSAAQVVPALEQVRAVRDQAGLTAQRRRANLRGAFRVAPALRHAVAGRACVLVDDVVTTGASLVEAARALRDAGAAEVVAAVVTASELSAPRRPPQS